MNKKTESADVEVRRVMLEGAKRAYFEVMLAGYTGSKKVTGLKVTVEKEKWHKKVTTRRGSYKVIDEWWTTPYSDSSAGTTTIFFRNVRNWHPIWWMSYSGQYPKEVIPFLKEALSLAYKCGQFVGGRGPRQYGNRKFAYFNRTDFVCTGESFTSFMGREEIRRLSDGEELGFHKYLGMSLI